MEMHLRSCGLLPATHFASPGAGQESLVGTTPHNFQPFTHRDIESPFVTDVFLGAARITVWHLVPVDPARVDRLPHDALGREKISRYSLVSDKLTTLRNSLSNS